MQINAMKMLCSKKAKTQDINSCSFKQDDTYTTKKYHIVVYAIVFKVKIVYFRFLFGDYF